MTVISVKDSTKKGHSVNRRNLINNWYLTIPKISTEPPSSHTAWLNRIAQSAVVILPLHHYESDLAHPSDLYTLVIEL